MRLGATERTDLDEGCGATRLRMALRDRTLIAHRTPNARSISRPAV